VKNRLKSSSTEEKLDVTSRLQKGERTVDACRNVRLAHSNIRTIGCIIEVQWRTAWSRERPSSEADS